MTDTEIRERLRERLHEVEQRITAACRRVDRVRASVTLVAVTKTVSARVAGFLPELGVVHFGESRPQQLVRKSRELKGLGIQWHQIGHLQRNKIDDLVGMTTLIHSVDSPRLLEALNKQASSPLSCLLEVNASREEAKHGFAPEEIPAVIATLGQYPNLNVQGLMTMAANVDDPELVRSTFRELRQLRNSNKLHQLSMGMSNDFEVAIEEGATLIRLGSILFEGLPAE